MNIHVLVFFWVYAQLGIAGSRGNSMFKLLRNRQAVSHRGWTVLPFHQPRTRVLVALPLCQRVLFSGCFCS